MGSITAFTQLSDAALLQEVARLASREAEATADLVASLVVLDQRGAYRAAGYGSLFGYCVSALGLSEDAAYRRIEVARAARRYPAILVHVASGALSLTAASLVARHLTEANAESVLAQACHRTKREVEELVARLAPRPDVAASLRKLPGPRGVATGVGTVCAETTARAHEPHLARPASGEADDAHPQVGFGPAPGSAPTTFGHRSPGRGGFQTRPYAVTGPEILGPTEPRPKSVSSPPDGAQRDAGTGPPMASPTTGPSAMGLDLAPSPAGEAAPGQPAAVVPTPRPAPAILAPLAPGRYRLQVTLGAETHAKFRRAQALLRRAIPDGDPAAVLDRALTLLVADLEKKTFAATAKPRRAKAGGRQEALGTRHQAVGIRHQAMGDGHAASAIRGGWGTAPPPTRTTAAAARQVSERTPTPMAMAPGGMPAAREVSERTPTPMAMLPGGTAATEPRASRPSRHIPAAVKRTVWARCEGRCSYVSAGGVRCAQETRLEYHHTVPYARGGRTAADTVTLLCAEHHDLISEQDFGRPARLWKQLRQSRRALNSARAELTNAGSAP